MFRNRREFIKSSLALLAASNFSSCASPEAGLPRSSESTNKALAINMWDFTWLLRSHPGGGFENWDRVLDELVERGYNALRIDCFPQFVAENDVGESQDIYDIPANKGRALWGNQKAISIDPKVALKSFLRLCKTRSIKIVLSSWFLSHGTKRNQGFKGVEGLVRAWDETLQFLQYNSLLEDVYYIDILNEFPLWHGYAWLTNSIKKLEDHKIQKNPRWDFLNKQNKKHFNVEQIKFYNHFLNSVLRQLKAKWPNLLFTVSQTNTLNVPWQDMDMSHLDALDIHLWMVYNKKFSEQTKYFDNIHILSGEKKTKDSLQLIDNYWTDQKAELTSWLDDQILLRSQKARLINIPLGNTEGWGAVMWEENKNYSWDFIKESGLIGARIGKKYNYAFNCSSNFNHPHFTGLWNDIEWHKEVTSIIKS